MQIFPVKSFIPLIKAHVYGTMGGHFRAFPLFPTATPTSHNMERSNGKLYAQNVHIAHDVMCPNEVSHRFPLSDCMQQSMGGRGLVAVCTVRYVVLDV